MNRSNGPRRGVATIRDVARLAAVSVASVSNALNDPERVSPALRARVTSAVEALGYLPHAAARNLRRRSSNLLGLLVADITNPFFTEMIRAIETVASAAGYSVLLGNCDETPAREEAHLTVLRAHRVGGILLAPTGLASARRTALLAATRTPIVLVDRALDGLGLDTIVLDNHLAARLAVDHLVALGHRRIALITGPATVATGAERLSGYRDALAQHGLGFDADLVRDAGFREAAAYQASTDLLARAEPPSAVLAANNLMTLGLMRALADLGRRCPGDVSVVAIDDLIWSSAFHPRLTTVAQPVEQMGRRAIGRLLDRISGRIDGPGETFRLPPELIVRESTAAPAALPPGRSTLH